MKTHAQNRRANILAQIPLTLTVGATLGTSNGLLYTTTPIVTLFGQSHAIDTRSVLVNGTPAVRSPWEARWTNSVTLLPGINRVLVQSLDSNSVEFARQTIEIWYDDGTLTSVSGVIATDAVWSAAQGPYQVTGNVTVNSGATLTIQAGTTVYLDSGVNITVASGGRLLAEGTDAGRIRFIAPPGSANRWGGIIIGGAVGSPESRITYAHFEGNGGTAIDLNGGAAFLDHLTFGTRDRKYLDLDGASFVVQNCVFPAPTAGLEPVHGTQGIRADGRGIVRRNFFGRVNGYNDAFDFTGGNRPGPILQVINNVFAGSDDDLLDFDSTDAWVEGNIFLHTHRNGSPDSASAISGGNENGPTSEITIVGNLFYNVDQAALAKQGNFYTMINNTIVNQNNSGSQDAETAVVILADDGTTQGAGIFLEANIISQAVGLTRNVTTALVTYTNNLFHQVGGPAWSGPGGNNQTSDPLFVHVPLLSQTTNFQSWADAQVLWDWLALREGSPAAERGPNGRDRGGAIPFGASVTGEPVGTTPLTSATLTVGVNRTGGGVPVSGFPNGSGFTHYKWRLDGGAWSAETPINVPISLNGLSPGAHHVEVTGKNDAGFYQDDPIFGEDAIVATSRTWIVAPGGSPVRINEVLAANGGSLMHFDTTPDAIELFNASDVSVNLTGMRLSDEADNPDKFIFPAGASIPARGYLVVFANTPDGTAGHHLGFGLSQLGESLYLFNSAAAGGALIDSVSFGLQLTDLSVGRLGDGEWALTLPTFGIANRAAATGEPTAITINEWLAIAQTPFGDDFVELYNSDPRPVDLGGWFLSDNLLGWPTRHRMPDLTFMAGSSFLQLIADGDADDANHLNFSLTSDAGMIALLLPGLTVIDSVVYQPQQPNIAQGRNPNGGTNIVFLVTPTPGAPNPVVIGPPPFGGALVINEVLASNSGVPESDGRKPDWVELYNGTGNAIDLADFSLTDTPLALRKFVFSNNTVIAAGGYLRLLCDDGRPATNSNTGFGLRAAGGAVYLFNSPANGGGHINSIVYGIQTPNLSIGRVPSGGASWLLNTPTPDAANNAVPSLGNILTLKVNEWMADPESGEDWFEIYNPSPLPVALGGLYLSDSTANRTKHQIAPLSFIGTSTNGYLQFHADNVIGAGADHVGFSLNDEGEAVAISTTNGTLIDGFTFGQQVFGVSQGRFPDGAVTTNAFPGTASPAAPNWRKLATVAINEVLTHTDEPFEDAVELRNLTGTAIDIGGWWLSDDDSELRKFQVPSPTVIPANGFVVIYESAFTNPESAAIAFALGSGGDEVVLSASSNSVLTGFRARVDFGAAANGVSFGRYVTSDGRDEFVPMSTRSFGVDDPGSVAEFRLGTGKTNAYPRVGPIVISEVMYHPPEIGTNDNTRDEFVELRNITTAAVPLYDVSF
ncbi:MAG TPA: lamin tail domain-containing protein, partial [Candidatus Acidoferrum sp.]|nr:lamin tail domain-containing protein [Candidatus Acidoferrum sp.]